MQARTAPSLKSRVAPSTESHDRLVAFTRLSDYAPGGVIHETQEVYDARLRFGPVQQTVADTCPADWLAARIKAAAQVAEADAIGARPIHVSAPTTALTHRNTADVCKIALNGMKACSQEICLVFEDAALSSTPAEALRAVREFRRAGYRVGINALRSWQSLRVPALMLMVDCVWINTVHLSIEADLADSVTEFGVAGVQSIGFGGKWSAYGEYEDAGLTHLFKARTDS